jgi:hypothetical protein
VTVRHRLAAVSAFYGDLVARGDVGVAVNPVPRGLPTRHRRRDGRGLPLVRGVRRLPRILEPGEVDVTSRTKPHAAGDNSPNGRALANDWIRQLLAVLGSDAEDSGSPE